jgi:uncharacterized protein with von Willebrand factor type A (vWA) domain
VEDFRALVSSSEVHRAFDMSWNDLFVRPLIALVWNDVRLSRFAAQIPDLLSALQLLLVEVTEAAAAVRAVPIEHRQSCERTGTAFERGSAQALCDGDPTQPRRTATSFR